MTLPKCPECGGGGYIWEGNDNSTVGIQRLNCPSCGGKGYVSEYVQAPISSIPVMWIKCPHCGKDIEVQQFQGSYNAFVPLK